MNVAGSLLDMGGGASNITVLLLKGISRGFCEKSSCGAAVKATPVVRQTQSLTRSLVVVVVVG